VAPQESGQRSTFTTNQTLPFIHVDRPKRTFIFYNLSFFHLGAPSGGHACITWRNSHPMQHHLHARQGLVVVGRASARGRRTKARKDQQPRSSARAAGNPDPRKRRHVRREPACHSLHGHGGSGTTTEMLLARLEEEWRDSEASRQRAHLFNNALPMFKKKMPCTRTYVRAPVCPGVRTDDGL